MGPADLERLLENARWVRALGVELAGASEGDDLAQEAWVVALEQPEGVRNPAAWLSGVVRRLAGRSRRAAERRTRREQAAARPEAQPPADELVAEAELSRALIRAVTELDEPFRATVLLRFYRGCTAEEIAASQGVPAATVRTRLHRALGKLRERLDREQGGRSAWALAFATPGMAAASPLATATIQGGTLMGVKAWAGGALALAAVVGVVLTRGRDESGNDSARNGSRAEREAPAEALLPPEPGSVQAESRREAAPAAAPARTFEEVLLFGALTDPAGEPVAVEFLTLEDEQGVRRGASRPEAGSYAVAGLVPGRYRLSVQAKGFLTLRETLELRGEAEHVRRDLVLAPGLSIPVKIRDETGAPWAEGKDAFRRGQVEVVVTPHQPEGSLASLQRNAGHLFGCGQLFAAGSDEARGLASDVHGLLRLRVPPPVFVSLFMRDARLDTRRLDGPLEELVLTLDRAALERRFGGLVVRFVDGLSGAPFTGKGAALDPPGTFSRGGAPLGADGLARFEGFAPGLYTLRLFDLACGTVERRVRVPEGSVVDLGDVPVWPRARIVATVLDASGQRVNASVRWAALDGLRGPADLELGSGYSSPGGQLELEDVPRCPVRLFVSARDHATLATTIDASGGVVEGLVLRLETGQPVLLRVPETWIGRQVTLFDSGGLPLKTWTAVGGVLSTRLVPGRYRIGVGRAEVVELTSELDVADAPLDLDLETLTR